MNSCLSQQELVDLMKYKMTGQVLEEELLASKIKLAENWSEPIGVLTYLLTRIIENKNLGHNDSVQLINSFFSLPDYMYIKIQEFDISFVDCLLTLVSAKSSQKSLTLWYEKDDKIQP